LGCPEVLELCSSLESKHSWEELTPVKTFMVMGLFSTTGGFSPALEAVDCTMAWSQAGAEELNLYLLEDWGLVLICVKALSWLNSGPPA
jgi:hypothetical protein